jgi:hypothetical protein
MSRRPPGLAAFLRLHDLPLYNEMEVPLPKFTPMPLARLHQPFDHADWLLN